MTSFAKVMALLVAVCEMHYYLAFCTQEIPSLEVKSLSSIQLIILVKQLKSCHSFLHSVFKPLFQGSG